MDIRGGSVCDKDAKLQRKEFARPVYHFYSVLLRQDLSQASGGRDWAGPRICRVWATCWVLSADMMHSASIKVIWRREGIRCRKVGSVPQSHPSHLLGRDD